MPPEGHREAEERLQSRPGRGARAPEHVRAVHLLGPRRGRDARAHPSGGRPSGGRPRDRQPGPRERRPAPDASDRPPAPRCGPGPVSHRPPGADPCAPSGGVSSRLRGGEEAAEGTSSGGAGFQGGRRATRSSGGIRVPERSAASSAARVDGSASRSSSEMGAGMSCGRVHRDQLMAPCYREGTPGGVAGCASQGRDRAPRVAA